MNTRTSNVVDTQYAAPGVQPMYVYGPYKAAGYAVNPLIHTAGGTPIETGVSAAEAFTQAGLNWRAETAMGGAVFPDGRVVSSKAYKAVVNPTTGQIVGMHRPTYTVVDHTAFIPVLDYHREDLKIENILSLNGGAKVFITASIFTEGEIVKGDVIRRYLHLFNAHDGSAAFGGLFSDERLWCANQMNGFLGYTAGRQIKAGYGFRAKHTQSVTEFASLLPQMLDLEKRTFTNRMEELRAMTKVNLTTDLQRRILEQTFATKLATPLKDKETGQLRERTLQDLPEIEVINEMAWGATGYGMDLPHVRGTVYGLYNALTQYETHSIGRGNDVERARARLESLWGGQSGKRLQNGFEACLAATR